MKNKCNTGLSRHPVQACKGSVLRECELWGHQRYSFGFCSLLVGVMVIPELPAAAKRRARASSAQPVLLSSSVLFSQASGGRFSH